MNNIYRLTVVILLVITGSFLVSCGNDENAVTSLDSISNIDNIKTGASDDLVQSTTDDIIYVYIIGEVSNPGVYSVSKDTRLYQVIDLAGGFTAKAKKNYLNLARTVTDGEQIEVISKKQYKQMKKGNTSDVSSQLETKETLTNINTASKDELMELPGIGESKANAIISYRQDNGEFSTIEDIMLVSGIKEAAFSQIKALITV